MPTESIHATRSAAVESWRGCKITGPPAFSARSNSLGISSAGLGRRSGGSTWSRSPAMAFDRCVRLSGI